ncbi:MAG TPA: YciI family protein [Gemmatimonadales bacterium]|jgi:hypothetical protein
MMRYMLIAKATQESEQGCTLKPELMAAIGRLTEEMTRAGTLLEVGGLAPTSKGARLVLSDGRVTVTDGPFAEAKEVIGGYAIVQVESKAEAVELSRRFLQLHADLLGPSYEAESEVRQFFDPSEYALEPANR